MTDRSKKSHQATSRVSHSVTGLPEYLGGVEPSSSPDGLTTDLAGLPAYPAKDSVWPESSSESRTSDTSGPCSSALSASAALQYFLANKCLASLRGATGSPEYVWTCKSWDMPQQPSIFALRARARTAKDGLCAEIRMSGNPSSSELPTSDSGFSGSRTILLSSGAECLVDSEDFQHLNQWKWKLHKAGYAYRNTRQGNVYMHRLILGLEKGSGIITDHINRIRLDNRKINLRAVTQSESNHNRALSTSGVTIPKGRRRWVVCLWINKKFQWLGSFTTKEEAIQARVTALLKEELITPQTLGGRPTPMAGTPAQNGNNAAGNNDSLRLTTSLMGWPTPQVCQGPNNGTNRGKNHGGERPRMTPQNIPQLVGWPSPKATNTTGPSDTATRQGGKDLQTVAQMGGWPTPRAEDSESSGERVSRGVCDTLTSVARLGKTEDSQVFITGWATPTVQDAANNAGPSQFERNSLPLNCEATLGLTSNSSSVPTAKRGVLNPAFSRWLMGYPEEWCLSAIRASRKLIKPRKGAR